jgi:hypothetical protein
MEEFKIQVEQTMFKGNCPECKKEEIDKYPFNVDILCNDCAVKDYEKRKNKERIENEKLSKNIYNGKITNISFVDSKLNDLFIKGEDGTCYKVDVYRFGIKII